MCMRQTTYGLKPLDAHVDTGPLDRLAHDRLGDAPPLVIGMQHVADLPYTFGWRMLAGRENAEFSYQLTSLGVANGCERED